MTSRSQQTIAAHRNRLAFPELDYYSLHAVKDPGEISDFKIEIVNWFAPVNVYVYLWQPVQLRNYLFTRNNFFRSAFKLPHFNNLWKNICKGSFAYNTFLFKKPAFSPAYNNTFLADLTCLALLFGDEFIDGLCIEAGKPEVQRLLNAHDKKFYLQINETDHPQLEYSFDLYRLLPEWIWHKKNGKYGIPYGAFYELLKDLLELMNRRLKKMPIPMAKLAADKVKEACDLCFNTFLHDVTDNQIQHLKNLHSNPTHWHDAKNIAIQERLLELRCLLLNKPFLKYKPFFKGWTNIISTMQVYDDMQDCRADDHFQDNLLLAIATENFPDEMTWFHEHKNKHYNDQQWRIQVSMNMPCSVYLSTKFIKQKMMNSMNWCQKKICNYLWKSNWFSPDNKTSDADNYLPHEKLIQFLGKTRSIYQLTGDESEWKSFTLEIAFHDRKLRNHILAAASWKQRYFIYFNFLQMSSYEKTCLMNRILSTIPNPAYE